jgi:sucrose-6-phosphate hydrolase SacC (GH32 family)
MCSVNNTDPHDFSPLGPWGKPVGFHIRDLSCGLNDPNGPVYDPKHKIYHLFYQDHMSERGGGGVVWGHVASKDLVHWCHLPVAIWNDQPYDNDAIYSGSANVVDGEVVLIYPGLCYQKNVDGSINDQCSSGRNIATAVPADSTDPLLIEWSKRGVIVNASNGNASHPNAKPDDGKDPSAAWQTAAGEWRFVTGGTPIMYGSMDFKSWYYLGTGFPMFPDPSGKMNYAGGDCPSLFPLPPKTPGAGPPPDTKREPTHVHMSFGGSMNLGWMEDGAPRTVGNWTPAERRGFVGRKSDHGFYYATKDFWDPVKGRRLLWGWAVPPLNAQSLAREMTWNPELRQLEYKPMEEQAQLRGAVLPVSADGNSSVTVSSQLIPQILGSPTWPAGVGNQSEIEVTFMLPIAPSIALDAEVGGNAGAAPALFGVVVMAGQDPTTSGTFLFVDFSPPSPPSSSSSSPPHKSSQSWPRTVTVGAMTGRTNATNTSLPGHFGFFCHAPGVVCSNDTLQLLERDSNITMRLFVDNNLVECYWQSGRVAITVSAPPTPEAQVALVSNVTMSAEDVRAWQVESMWVDKEDLLTAAGL